MRHGTYLLLITLFLLMDAGCSFTVDQTPSPQKPSALPPSPSPTQTQLPTPMLPPASTPTPTMEPKRTAKQDPTVFELRSPAFGMEEKIPRRFTCNDKDISPPLIWGNPPEATQSFVLLMDDITVGNFVHWVYFNIPADLRALPEGLSKDHFDDGSQQGINQRFELGYGGPCPMPGPNRYRFRLFAIDTVLDLEDGVMMIPLKAAMEGHILAETELIGVYP